MKEQENCFSGLWILYLVKGNKFAVYLYFPSTKVCFPVTDPYIYIYIYIYIYHFVLIFKGAYPFLHFSFKLNFYEKEMKCHRFFKYDRIIQETCSHHKNLANPKKKTTNQLRM